jgi:hypothetical protein
MKLFARNHLFKSLALLIAGPALMAVYFTDFNVIELGIKNLDRIKSSEIDEVIVSFVGLILGMVADQMRARARVRHHSEIEAHRVHVLKATMRTVQDLVNNFLSNMQLFRMEAEDGPLSAESLELLDSLIFETSEKLTALGASGVVSEIQMANGIGIQAPHQPAILAAHTGN